MTVSVWRFNTRFLKMAACCTCHQLKYYLLTVQTNKNRREPHRRAYFSENGGLGKKRSGVWAKSRKGIDRKSDSTRQKNKRGDIDKWDQTDSPDIPDRGETSETPWPPFEYKRLNMNAFLISTRQNSVRIFGNRCF